MTNRDTVLQYGKSWDAQHCFEHDKLPPTDLNYTIAELVRWWTNNGTHASIGRWLSEKDDEYVITFIKEIGNQSGQHQYALRFQRTIVAMLISPTDNLKSLIVMEFPHLIDCIDGCTDELLMVAILAKND